ncbi:MAG TPA: LysM peptidoglycan-binding domain-containing protein [Gammaproteobacteria bacterium]
MPRNLLPRLCLAVVIAIAPALATAEDEFPRPKQLEAAVQFWTRVYTEVDTRGGFIHDSERLDIVYETVRDTTSEAARRRQVDAAMRRYRDILTKLGRGVRDGLDAEERRVLALFPEGTSNAEFRAAAGRLRFQLGQADRFKAGLIRSGIWRDYILDVLERHGVPPELVALPHVESSFDPTAYSKAGAAGMWQFTRSTGLRYMRIDHIVDERRDPFLSTEAAARLLRDNYEVLGHWPLAITAYNHGVAGMRRAVSQLGTTDMGVIAERYNGRTFGFASRNFYAAFLAAVDIDADPEKYFGKVDLAPASPTIVAEVPDYMSAQTLSRALGIGVSRLRELNPALTPIVWSGEKYVPRGFPLRLPGEAAGRDPDVLLASVPAGERFAAQLPDVEHRVARGETLSQIAARYRVSVASLVEINGLRSSHMIRAGQVLKLPVPAGQAPVVLASTEPVLTDGEYVVQSGDTIERIARRFGVDVDALLSANGIRNKNLIYAGQRLRVPTAGAAPEVVLAAATPDIAAEAREAVLVETPDEDAAALAADALLAARAPAESEADDGDEAGAAEALADLAADAPRLVEESPDTEASLESNVLASHQAELAADPSDYAVSDGKILVQALETLGHYADWLQIRTQRLRDLNGLAFHQSVVIGQSLRLDFSRVSPEEFERRRIAYHRQLQEEFFSSHRIEDVEDHVIRRGESLWVLAQRTYNVPVWLLRQYNPDLDLDHVRPGTVVKFPRLRPIDDEGQLSI